MQKIDIQITKARISSFTVTLHDDFEKLPDVSATINLYGANGKFITTFYIATTRYSQNNFKLPVEVFEPIVLIAKQLEEITTATCQRTMKALPSIENGDFA